MGASMARDPMPEIGGRPAWPKNAQKAAAHGRTRRNSIIVGRGVQYAYVVKLARNVDITRRNRRRDDNEKRQHRRAATAPQSRLREITACMKGAREGEKARSASRPGRRPRPWRARRSKTARPCVAPASVCGAVCRHQPRISINAAPAAPEMNGMGAQQKKMTKHRQNNSPTAASIVIMSHVVAISFLSLRPEQQAMACQGNENRLCTAGRASA